MTGAETAYSVTVRTDPATGGSAAASVSSATAGTTVTVRFTPNDGYTLSKITWQPEGGTATTITSSKSFTMPSKNVTVNVTFKRVEPTVTGSVSGSKLTYTVSNIPTGARLIAARYDAGRMTDVRIITDIKTSGAVTLGGSGSGYRIFLIDDAGRPLCRSWSN